MLKCNKFIIDYSPKAGCTIIVKTWFDYMGVLDEALNFEVFRKGRKIKGWVHNFTETFLQRFGGISGDDLYSSDFIKIKYVRNPYNRAVSSYIHCCKHPFLFEEFAETNPSFNEFLLLLYSKKLGINCGHEHYRLQNSFPKVEYDDIIKIENLKNETKKLNKKYDLNLNYSFNCKSMPWHHQVEKKNKIDNFFNISASDVRKYLFKNKNLPVYDSFYNDEIKQIVYEIYKIDIKTYGYQFGE